MEPSKAKQAEKKLLETEELSFLLQSGIVLCKLADRILPTTDIQIECLQVITTWILFLPIFLFLQAGNLITKRKNISLFLQAAASYGVPEHLLFKPDHLAVQAHFYK